jgi:hypothetical protein
VELVKEMGGEDKIWTEKWINRGFSSIEQILATNTRY